MKIVTPVVRALQINKILWNILNPTEDNVLSLVLCSILLITTQSEKIFRSESTLLVKKRNPLQNKSRMYRQEMQNNLYFHLKDAL